MREQSSYKKNYENGEKKKSGKYGTAQKTRTE